MVIATRCVDKAGEGPWNIITNEFYPYQCATRLRPLNSSELTLVLNNYLR